MLNPIQIFSFRTTCLSYLLSRGKCLLTKENIVVDRTSMREVLKAQPLLRDKEFSECQMNM